VKKFVFARVLLCIALTAGIAPLAAHGAAGDLYDGGLNTPGPPASPIYKFNSAGTRTVFISGTYTDWLAFDSKGNLFAGAPPSGVILKITPAGVATNFATGITPAGIAFDATGNLFAINTANSSIVKYTPTGTVTTFASGLGGGPVGLAFDTNGNLYLSLAGNAMSGGGSIVKFAPNGTSSPFASGLFLPAGLAVDSADNVYVADLGSGSVFRFTPTGTKTTFTSGLSSPRSLAFDRNGVLYVGEFGTHDIVKFPGGVKTAFSHDDTFIGGLAFEPPTAQLTNISTRAFVQTGNQVLIAGFILTGTDPKQVIVRGLGPTLGQPPFNVPNVLADPTLDLHDSTSSIATNDNWQTAANANQIPTSPVDYRPPNSLESAILITLQPGAYTAIMSGKNSTTGNGLVEVYDLATSTFSQLTNVSTRGFVGTGDTVMIGGFITSGGNGSTQVVIRGLGPTLGQPPFNVPNVLADPALTLVNGNGNIVASNNNWKDTQPGMIIAASCNGSTCAPPNDLEAAILTTVAPGNYTATLSGQNGGTGIGLVEVYKLR
jgi:sugar lactone lactonase YvrE